MTVGDGYRTIGYDLSNGVATITLDRPDRLNAFTGTMMRELLDVDWDDITEAAPSALTALMMPFTYSIANGLAFGFISYAVIKLATGRVREVHPATWLVAALFLIRFAFFVE